ncbi:MAG: hypothetical protein WAZ77_06020 [Candidatus Nitrosopolaris sp.]
MSCKLDVLNLIRCKYNIISGNKNQKYFTIPASPATGILYITQNSPDFISGHVRVKGRNNGRYPYNYLEMIDAVFGKEENTIEVCSYKVKEYYDTNCFTVDVKSATNPDLVADGQTLSSIPSNSFNRWRCDPPYNVASAKSMYGTDLPTPMKLLQAGARICKIRSLMFLLLGPKNYQMCPQGIKRIGWIGLTVVPNNEVRSLHVYYKYAEA